MIIKIVCNGHDSFSKLYQKNDHEFLVGIDGGSQIIIKNKLPLDLAIGDFDSANFQTIEKKAKETITFSREKDDSDLKLALEYIASPKFSEKYKIRNIDRIIIYNATGRRLDHYHANILLLYWYTHLPIEVIDEYNKILVTNSIMRFNKKQLKKEGYKYVSFFALEFGLKLSLTGFKYPLTNANLQMNDVFAISNELVEDEGTMVPNNKKVLVFLSK